MTRVPSRSAGFTLIEAIMVIVITGILSSIVAVFITKPVQGYVDSVRRAELTDAADVALRRMSRDIRLALPNSLRLTDSAGHINSCSSDTCYIEFIMTQSGSLYRTESDGSTGGNGLSFGADTSFDVLGAMPERAINDFIVIYNDGSSGLDAYTGDNRAKINLIAGNTVTLASPIASTAPLKALSNGRFQVVPGGVRAVTYACPVAPAEPPECPTSGWGNLQRYWNYDFNASQTAPSGGSSALLASNVTCTVEYGGALPRIGLLYIKLKLTDPSSGECVSLFQQIHVDNAP